MASLKFFLDKNSEQFGKYQIKITLSHNHSGTTIATDVYASEEEVDFTLGIRPISGSDEDSKRNNEKLAAIWREYDDAIFRLNETGEIRFMTPSAIRTWVNKRKKFASVKTFWDVYDLVLEETTVQKTAETYRYMAKVLRDFSCRKILPFEAIDSIFLNDWMAWMSKHSEVEGKKGISATSQAIILRHARAIYNKGIAMGLVSKDLYPFRAIKMPRSKKKKGFMSINDFRKLRDVSLEPMSPKDRARDFFLLSFYLCGTNPIDIWRMPPARDGYIEYMRSKTQERNPEVVRMRILPAAQAIIDKWQGKNTLVDYCDEYASYESFYAAMRHRFDDVCVQLKLPSDTTFYTARRTWATYAIHEEVPEYVIDKSLQHADKSVAARHYITYDWRLTDKANRMVHAFVEGDKDWDDGDVSW